MDTRKGLRLDMSLPCALGFPDMDPPEGWGRLLNLSTTGAKVESRWPMKIGQAVYLTFIPQGDMRLENLRARVVRVQWEDGYYIGGLIFDESVDQNYLREALVVLVNQ
jgi:hypothetical protein